MGLRAFLIYVLCAVVHVKLAVVEVLIVIQVRAKLSLIISRRHHKRVLWDSQYCAMR